MIILSLDCAAQAVMLLQCHGVLWGGFSAQEKENRKMQHQTGGVLYQYGWDATAQLRLYACACVNASA